MKFKSCLIMMLALTPTMADLGQETNPPAAAAPKAFGAVATFSVRSYLVEGNTALPPEKIDAVLTNYTGEAVSVTRMRRGLGELQLLYRQLGFATISVSLPQQRLTNGVVRVQVVEGKLSNITVTGNRYSSSNNVRRALPSLTTNVLLNTKWFQPELDQANANQDRQIYPAIAPGLDPGTTDLTLKVKDRLPLHGHIEVNDKSTPGTPLLRTDSALQYNNLWQHEHQAGLQHSFSPQEMKPDDCWPRFFDQPMVASYSGFYRIPLALRHGLRDTYDGLPVNFGYDEITHRFNLPPATGNPELIVYASRSTSDTPIQLGPVIPITNTALADISSQFAQRTLSFNENLGTKLTIPIREFAGIRSSFLLGFDYKSFESQSFTTNLTYFDLYALDEFGNRVLVTNLTIALGTSGSLSLDYMPISIGWSGARPDNWGATSFSFNQSFFFQSLATARTNFQAVSGSGEAGGDYTTINASLIREQKLPKDWSVLLRASGQWSSAPLINNEQFALGGTAGVRGYPEGAAYGDTGWRVLGDLRAPAINVGYFPTSKEDVPASLRASWFMDYGGVYLLDRPELSRHHLNEWGTGLDFLLTVGDHFQARLTIAWALAEAASRANPTHTLVTSAPGSAQAYFSVGYQF